MLWIVIAAGTLTAIAIRFAALRGRPEVWWLSFTMALAGILAGSLLLVDEGAVNRLLGVPNIAYLLSQLSYVVAGGSVTIYVHTLRSQHPFTPIMTVHAALAGLVGIVITVGWLAAPIHDVSYPAFREVPVYPEALAYDWLFHIYFIPVLANVSLCSLALARATSPEDPARRIGLIFISASSALDIIAHALYLVRLALQPRIGAQALPIAVIADVITVVAVLGIAAGTVALLAVPNVIGYLRSRHLVGRLRPLWHRIRDLYPSVALPKGQIQLLRPAIQAERMIIEITDALRLIEIDPRAPHGPLHAAAQVITTGASSPAREAIAVSALITPRSRLEEEEQVLELAHLYRELRESTAHAS